MNKLNIKKNFYTNYLNTIKGDVADLRVNYPSLIFFMIKMKISSSKK